MRRRYKQQRDSPDNALIAVGCSFGNNVSVIRAFSFNLYKPDGVSSSINIGTDIHVLVVSARDNLRSSICFSLVNVPRVSIAVTKRGWIGLCEVVAVFNRFNQKYTNSVDKPLLDPVGDTVEAVYAICYYVCGVWANRLRRSIIRDLR